MKVVILVVTGSRQCGHIVRLREHSVHTCSFSENGVSDLCNTIHHCSARSEFLRKYYYTIEGTDRVGVQGIVVGCDSYAKCHGENDIDHFLIFF